MLLTHPYPAVIVGCLPPFKSLFSSGFSTSRRYTGSGGHSGSIPLNTPDDTYKVRAKGKRSGYWDSDSQTKIVRRDEEGDDTKLGDGDIRVERVFVSLFAFSFLWWYMSSLENSFLGGSSTLSLHPSYPQTPISTTKHHDKTLTPADLQSISSER